MHVWKRKRILSVWLVAGSLLLTFTSLQPWVSMFGWAPLLWLVVSPLCMLFVIEPGWAGRWLARLVGLMVSEKRRIPY